MPSNVRVPFSLNDRRDVVYIAFGNAQRPASHSQDYPDVIVIAST
jgi:hypothetical protein